MIQFTRDDNRKARRMFERAIEVEPDYAPTYGMMGMTYISEYANGWSRDPALLDRAEGLGRRSVELDPTFPVGHLALGYVNLYRGNLDEAIAAADRAIERAPSVEWPHVLRSLALAQKGRVLEASGSIRRALRINPRGPTPLLLSVAFVNMAAGRDEEAVALMERVRSANRDNLGSRVVLAMHYQQTGRSEEASAAVREIQRVRPDLSADEAMEIVPGLERVYGADRFARSLDGLREAGLP
jgi:tetratricopeptide (TPR) repeat protein